MPEPIPPPSPSRATADPWGAVTKALDRVEEDINFQQATVWPVELVRDAVDRARALTETQHQQEIADLEELRGIEVDRHLEEVHALQTTLAAADADRALLRAQVEQLEAELRFHRRMAPLQP